ncbi:MAG TPA: glycoside hydrolase family 36 protein [Phycisphaerae bacterium]|nr:glycoside hydrolase family 36 protein [Phycisphaerae bacterium]
MSSLPFITIMAATVTFGWAAFAAGQPGSRPDMPPALTFDFIKTCPGRVIPAEGIPATESDLQLIRQWVGNVCKSTLANRGERPLRVREVVLLSIPHSLPESTPFWGEGFQMVTQTGGTLGQPADLGFFADRDMYRIPQPPGATTVYNVLTLSPHNQPHVLLGFTSCKRFSGCIRLYPRRMDVVLDLEDLEIPPGQSWPLEELVYDEGLDREALLAGLAGRIAVHHPPLRWRGVPTGWCSWYCFGPDVTARQLEANFEVITRKTPQLKYLQIDDGYQAAMGDWLVTRQDFGGDLAAFCRRCKAAGLEPAIWVAPFIAEEDSRVFREHPDWFVRDEAGKPLRSDRVTFGGWRRGPWYALDGTHPGACRHLENLFRTLRNEWGCTYFKLDANYWGAMHGGRHHDPKATRVEAYRRGMEAILRGAGDAFILGCNHPMWPSLGLVHGARNSMDAGGEWEHLRKTTREAFNRNWQHGRFWLNDPDVVMLAGDHSADYLHTRAAVALASGGLILAGDDLATLPDDRLAILHKLLPPTGKAARFNEDQTIGTIDLPAGRMVVLFNWTGEPKERSVSLSHPSRIRDFWSEEDLGIHREEFRVKLRPQSSRVFFCTPATE